MRPLPTLVLTAAAMFALAACTTASPKPDPGRFVARTIEVAGVTRHYQVFVPSPAVAGARPPIVLFLHGSGERGEDGAKQVGAGLGPAVRARAADFPAIVVFPQAPDGSEWSDHPALALATLDAAVDEFGGDPARVYLTGMSMGGYGTWDLAVRHPDRFAALVPVCGGVTAPGDRRPTLRVTAVDGADDPFAAVAAKVRDIPTWIFHGARDDLVLPEQSRRMHAALQAADAREVRYTEWPDANHNSWDVTYADPAMWDWLLAQRRSP